MRETKVKRKIMTLLVLVVAIFVIAGTYARYSSTGTATATMGIAKWSVALTSGGNDLLSDTQEIAFTVQENENVAAGKIAPGSTAIGTVELDLTGTEVAVDFYATIDETALSAQNLGLSYDKLKLTTKLGNTNLVSGEPLTISLENGSAFTAQNGVKTITLELTWENDDENNLDDTAMGAAGSNIVIPVTFTVEQHIGPSTSPSYIAAGTYTRGEEVEFKGEKFFVVDDTGNSVLLLAKYCLNQQGTAQTDRNTTTGNNGYGKSFSSSKYWNGKTQDGVSYDLQTSESLALIPDTDTVANNAIITAREYGASKGVTGRLMTKAEAEGMIATNSDIMFGKWKDGTQPTQGYLFWWIGATNGFSDNYVSFVRGNVDTIGCDHYYLADCGVRPLLIVQEL